MAVFSALLVYLFYLSYSAWGVEPALWPDWSADHPYWRAWAHAAFVLLFLSLILGPLSKLWEPTKRLLPWRRELGIWFAVLAFGHAHAIWDRWAQSDVGRLFGFEYVEEIGSYVLSRPELGIMNMMGLVVLPMIVLLAVTSFDRAVSFLGISSWKWLHGSLVHTIFYILILRGVLYFFFFFQASPPEWRIYPSIWFLYVFLGMGLFVVILQAAAFVKTVLQQRAYGQENTPWHITLVASLALLFVMPMALVTGTVAYFDSRVVKENPALSGQAQAPDNYSQAFHMTIRDSGQDIHLWVRNLDDAPYFRQTIQVGDSVLSHQVYRYGERALYSAEPDETGNLLWSKTENVSPEQIGLTDIAAGPGVWAAQYGIGEHQMPLEQGPLSVTIHSVDEEISDEIFDITNEANPTPLRQ